MLKVVTTASYRKSLRKLNKSGKFDLEELNDIVICLCNGKKLSGEYRDHFLVGVWSGCRECHIKPDLLLIYKVEKDILFLLLADIGSHSELFG